MGTFLGAALVAVELWRMVRDRRLHAGRLASVSLWIPFLVGWNLWLTLVAHTNPVAEQHYWQQELIAQLPAGENAKLIDIETFVPDDQIDPIFYDKTYYLGAGDDGEDAFRLLRKALEETDKVAIGRWVFHERERLVAVKPLDGVLGMHVMNFHDEVVEPDDLDLPSPQKNPTERELEMAGKLVKSLQTKFQPGNYKDSYREAVLKVIERKKAGEEIETPEPEPKEETDDLMKALEASLG
jgi:DNA end-binding protein Ku